jgi:hypothetical protein
VAAEVVEAAELRPRPLRRLMVTLPPQLQLLRAAQAAVAALVRAVGIRLWQGLLLQLQPTEPRLRLSLPQQADAVAEVEVLLRPLQWKSFRRLPKVHWQLRCKSLPA